MIALAVITAALAAPDDPVRTGAAGLSGGVIAVQSPARHTLAPTLGAWLDYGPGPFGIAGELGWTRRAKSTSLYDFDVHMVRAAALAEWVVGTRPLRFHAGAGLALSARAGQVGWNGADQGFVVLEPGARVRVALDGPLGRRLAWQWQVGTTSRGLRAWDYDTSLGLGVRW
ncbi:MAG: hypothetical protein H6739_21160 [Alphaproteobacteria bacterium]|nr:hypothetical protein [Alphaproteobacteria bacterium]